MMKRTISILMAVLMLTGMLTACSGTMTMDDGRDYGNVSTTRDGTVNGTNGYNGDWYEGGHYRGGYQSGGSNGAYNGGTYNGGAYNDYQSGSGMGTGMTGGR